MSSETSPLTDAVVVSHVSFGYNRDEKLILDDITLSIPSGTITAVLGPNGVGKTTLLNLLLRWLIPITGTIHLCGGESSNYSRREMGTLISLVPQDEHIPFEYTLLDYVLLGRAPHLSPLQAPGPEDIRVARFGLDRVGLGALAHQPVSEISGGEKQLAMIARSLTQAPRILLIDEGSAHLDLKNRRHLVDVLHQLRDEGITVICTTHDPDFASAAAERMVLLHQGRLLSAGPLAAVMTEKNLQNVFDIPLKLASVGDRKIVIW